MSNLVDNYGWQSEQGPQSGGYLAPFVAATLKRLGVKRVLDLGSGNGHLCGVLHSQGFDVVGVEYDPGGVEISKRAYPRIPFYRFGVQDDPNQLLMEQSPFDIVVSTEVIEHLFSPHLLPSFARGVLKPAGRLLVTTPYHGYLKNVAIALAGKWDHHHTALWHGGHIKFWSRESLSRLLRDQGFDVTEFHGVGRLPLLWKSMALIAQKTAREPAI